MLDIVNVISTVIPVLAITFVLTITFVNLFIKIRKKYPIKVNCWFCNTDSKVPYDNYNSWICINCEQYNGFKENGDYNQEIPAQYVSKLNPKSIGTDDATTSISSASPTNGLCFGCNRNQELKIYQIASFVPEDEDNYDEEIEEYEKKLEQAYRLCGRCDRVLKKTLNSVKRNILGSKLAQIGVKGLSVFDLHMESSSKLNAVRKKRNFTRICIVAIILLLATNFIQTISKVDVSKQRLEQVFSPSISHTFLVAISYFSSLKQIMVTQLNKWPSISLFSASQSYLQYLPQLPYLTFNRDNVLWNILLAAGRFESKFLLNFSVITLNILLLCLNDGFKNMKPLSLILICSFDMFFTSWMSQGPFMDIIPLDLVKVIVSLTALLLSYSCTEFIEPKMNSQQNVNTSFHKIYSEYNSEVSDESDTEFETSRGSIKSRRSLKKNMNMSGNSLSTTKSLSPSVFTASTLRPFSDTASFVSSAQSHYDHNNTFNRATSHSSLLQEAPSMENFASIAAINRGETFNNFKLSMDSLNNSTFYHDDHFQKDIDRLSISGRQSTSRRDLSMANNPFAVNHEPPRKVTVTPPRPSQMPDPQASWVAGGYWSSSPQKQEAPVIDFCPIMSRTSSQSSGFESQTSAFHRHSPDDKASLFSEAPYNFASNASSVSAFDNSFLNNTVIHNKPHNFLPPPSVMMSRNYPRSLFGEQSIFQQPHNLCRNSQSGIFPPQQSHTPLYHQFGTQRMPPQQRPPLLNKSLLNLSKLGINNGAHL